MSRVFPVLLGLSAVLLTACPGAVGGDDDAGTAELSEEGESSDDTRGDAGSTDAGSNDAGTSEGGTGTGGGATTSLDLGAPCAYGSNACGEGKVCSSLFGPGTAPDTSTAACYATCETVGQACTAAFGQTGSCQQGPDGNVCLVASPNLGPCGNGANASCVAEAPLCLTGAGATVGICGRICDPADVTTCKVTGAGTGCGCLSGQECSTSNVQVVTSDAENPDGVCAAPSTIGAACGVDPATGVLQVCTGDQTCELNDGSTTEGTCQLVTAEDGTAP
ncbi:MAG: hypothetical protein ACO3JL_20135 [Myxococcota bacterium]